MERRFHLRRSQQSQPQWRHGDDRRSLSLLTVSAGIFTVGTVAGTGAFTLTGGGTLALTRANAGQLNDNGVLQIAGTALFTGLAGSGAVYPRPPAPRCCSISRARQPTPASSATAPTR